MIIEIIDSHCHLNSFDSLPEIIQRAKEAGVSKIVTIGTQINDNKILSSIKKEFGDYIDVTVGVHPDESDHVSFEEVQDYFHSIDWTDVIGIGEIGLDYRNSPDEPQKKQQQALFQQQLEWAQEKELPISIHMRQASQDTFDLIRQFPKLTGVMHCFCEDRTWAQRFLDLGFLISFSGIVTFKNAKAVQDSACYVPLDRILVETDAPYLAPTPYRGQTNEPSYVVLTAQFIAQIRNISFDQLAEQTTRNFYALFKKATVTV